MVVYAVIQQISKRADLIFLTLIIPGYDKYHVSTLLRLFDDNFLFFDHTVRCGPLHVLF